MKPCSKLYENKDEEEDMFPDFRSDREEMPWLEAFRI